MEQKKETKEETQFRLAYEAKVRKTGGKTECANGGYTLVFTKVSANVIEGEKFGPQGEKICTVNCARSWLAIKATIDYFKLDPQNMRKTE